MFKKICGWVFFIFGIFIALCGVLAIFGGADIWVLLKLLGFGLLAASIGWQMRGNQNQ